MCLSAPCPPRPSVGALERSTLRSKAGGVRVKWHVQLMAPPPSSIREAITSDCSRTSIATAPLSTPRKSSIDIPRYRPGGHRESRVSFTYPWCLGARQMRLADAVGSAASFLRRANARTCDALGADDVEAQGDGVGLGHRLLVLRRRLRQRLLLRLGPPPRICRPTLAPLAEPLAEPVAEPVAGGRAAAGAQVTLSETIRE